MRQSEAKISLESRMRRRRHEFISERTESAGRRVDRDGVVGLGVRTNAMRKEMEPLSNSLRRTAAAGEYALDAGVDTRE